MQITYVWFEQLSKLYLKLSLPTAMAACSDSPSSPTSPPDDWQTKKNSVRERNSYMFNNELMSDVHFLVGETGSAKLFPAHKYVLATSSPVFFAMFYGGLAEGEKEIVIPDSEPEAFEEFLRFLYSDEVVLTDFNIMGTMYLSQKYIVPSLTRTCVEFLEEELSASNVMSIFAQARRFEECELEQKCWEIIRKETQAAMESEDFLNMRYKVLKTFLEDEYLGAPEIEIFKAVNRWAENHCRERKAKVSGRNKRKLLGDCIYLIRFPIMTKNDFVTEVIPNEILKTTELTEIAKTWKSDAENDEAASSVFKTTWRQVSFSRCFRFKDVLEGNSRRWCCKGTKYDGINFTVDKSARICGVRLFGSDEPSYSIIGAMLLNECGEILTDLPATTYNCDNIGTEGFVGFDVLFENPVLIQPKKVYSVAVCINGNDGSYYGEAGRKVKTVSGVTFTFRNYSGSNNGTNVGRGQIAEILFDQYIRRDYHPSLSMCPSPPAQTSPPAS